MKLENFIKKIEVIVDKNELIVFEFGKNNIYSFLFRLLNNIKVFKWYKFAYFLKDGILTIVFEREEL